MPEPKFLPGFRNTLPEEKPEPPKPGFLDILPDAFARENVIGSAIVADRERSELSTVQPAGYEYDGSFTLQDPDFDPFESLIGTRWAEHAKRFIPADSPEEVEMIKSQIDRGIERRQNIDSANGFVGFMADFAAAITSPETFIPVGGATYRGLRTGQSISRNALSVSAAAAGGAGVSETLLQATQEGRTMQETLVNVLGAAAFGGVLGGGVGVLARGKGAPNIPKEIFNDPAWSGIEVDADALLNYGKGSVGAAKAPELPIELERLKSAYGAEKALSFLGPQTRVLVQSGSKSAMKAVQGLAESAFVFKKNEQGIVTASGGAVETAGKAVMGKVVSIEDSLAENFTQYRMGKSQSFKGDVSLAMQDLTGRTNDKLKRHEFSEQVFFAMQEGGHEIPEIASAAQAMRTHMDALGKEAEELGMIPKGLVGKRQKNGAFYTPIIYQKDAIRKKRRTGAGDGFEERVAQHYQESAAEVEERLNELYERKDVLDAQAREQEANLPDDIEMANIRRYGRKEPQKYPVLDILRSMGGVKSGSVLARELNAMGVTSRTHVGLFRNKGGIGDVDNIVQSEYDAFLDLPVTDETTYMDPAVIYDLIGEELAGNPIVPRSADQDMADFYKMMFDRMQQEGVDFSRSNAEVRRQLLSNRFRIERDVDGNIIRDLGEGEYGGRPELDTDYQASLDQQGGQFGADAAAELKDVTEMIEALQKHADASDPAVARQLAEDTTNKILGMSDADLYRPPEPGRRGFLKERLINIDPALIREFTQNNAVAVNRRYSRVLATDIEMVKKFGDVQMTRTLEDIKIDYAELRASAIKDRVVALGKAADGDAPAGPLAYLRETSEGNKVFTNLLEGIDKFEDVPDQQVIDILSADKQIMKAMDDLGKKEEAALRDVRAIRDRIRGQFDIAENPHDIWNRTERGLLGLNYMRLLGGMVISAFPDLAMGVFRNGLQRNLAVHMKLMGSAASYRESTQEMRLAGVGTELAMDTRLSALTEYEIGEGAASKFGRATDAAQRAFGKVTLMTPWNAALKQMNGVVYTNFVVEAARRIAKGTASQKEITELASWNIDAQLAKEIVDQIDRHAPNYDKELLVGFGNWSNKQAAEEFRRSIITQVDKTIITPGQEKPLWMSKRYARLAGQFKSFGMASTQMILVSGMQRRGAEQLTGVMALIALGTVSYAIKEQQAGRELPPVDLANSAEWLKNGIDRSGVTGILFDANNIMEKVTDGAFGVSALTDTDVAQRYKSRNKLGAVLGPSAGTVNDLLGITGDAVSGDWSTGTSGRARRLLPFQNAIGIRKIFDQFENGLNTATGAIDKKDGRGANQSEAAPT